MSEVSVGEVRCVWNAKRSLGEGVWWSVAEQSLYWLDIKRSAVLRYDPHEDSRHEWPSPEPIGCFAPRKGGGFVGGFRTALSGFDLASPGTPIEPVPLATPARHGANDRFNDGKCHPDGTFWAGTMDDAEEEARGYFYRLLEGMELECLSGPHMVCNGPAFSRDGRFAYLTDSAERTIYRIDAAGGTDRIERFMTFGEQDGYPDGMTTDSDGRLWIAFWDGSKVMCLSPQGERLAEISLPVSRPTSCAFGGSDLSTLYITSASVGLDPEELTSQPLAGGLFACPVAGSTGWPAPAYGG
ncbi:MAG: SMP-30/gluconolactonase/LRE family protein [Pseudomonadota bacterium]